MILQAAAIGVHTDLICQHSINMLTQINMLKGMTMKPTITLLALTCAGLASALPAQAGDLFNRPGNILITDQFNNRVLEVTRSGKIAWSFGRGGPSQCVPSADTVIAPNDAERLGDGLTLIVGTGTGACPDNRVIVVEEDGRIVFQYGQAGVAGAGPNQLNVPVFAIQTGDGDFLITDQANNRIIKVNLNKQILYKYGPASGLGALNNPNSAELLQNQHILIADENNSRVIEIDPAQQNKIVFQYKQGLNIVAFASRLRNGNTLIADSGNNRILEINKAKQVVFDYATNAAPDSNPNPNPTGAVRLKDGNTLIADQFNDRVIIITPEKQIIFQYGTTNVVGNGRNQLNAPYSAVAICDYTGLTPPAGEGADADRCEGGD
jgi:hypothetical protein